MTTITATYSPDDNKLRLTASQRLDAETYARVKAAGFSWAPKLEQFIAPMWTPARADLALELAGQIDDEDSTLADRAEDRAERFEVYSHKRASESERAAEYARKLADGIPFGQPILVGHHSQRHAERGAKRIENGMRKAVDLFDTAEYWKRRAAGALRHARYKELPAVRHRRIKGLEADQRKYQKTLAEYETAARLWGNVPRFEWDKQTEIATIIAGRLPSTSANLYSALSHGRMHGDRAWRVALAGLEQYSAWPRRWLDHIANRLTYERAMLNESGGIEADQFDLQPGGTITHRGRRSVILRVNRKDGAAVSVSVTGQGWTLGVEEITSYEAPSEAAAEAVKVVTTKAPLVNFPGQRFIHITRAQWDDISTDYKATRNMGAGFDATSGGQRHDLLKDYRADSQVYVQHRVRVAMGALLRRAAPESWAAMLASNTAAHEKELNTAHGYHPVFITDAKTTEPARLDAPPKAPRKSMARKIAEAAGIDTSGEPDREPAPTLTEAKTHARAVLTELTAQAPRAPLATQSAPVPGDTRHEIEAMRESLRTGVQVVSAPQLFPTPPDLAARMVELAGVQRLDRVLEPSAGTGRIVQAVAEVFPLDEVTLHAYEINGALAGTLQRQYMAATVRSCDFLAQSPENVKPFDRVLMNPPFAGGADVDHVTHAVRFLAPGGRLVAIMSAGVNFREDRKTREFRALVDRMDGYIEPLPADTFATSGTGVNTVLVVLDAPPAGHVTHEGASEEA